MRTAADAGLNVKGVSRADASQSTVLTIPYTVQSLHLTVSGRVDQVYAFLVNVATKEPALIASLASMTANDAGVVQADVVFSSYARVPTPTAVPVVTPRSAR